jgi:biotin carboxyl carrier protein
MPTRYTAMLGGIQHEIELSELAANSFKLKFAGQEHELDVRRIGLTSYSILAGDRSFDLDVIRDGEELIVSSRGASTRVTLVDARSRARRAAAGGRQEIAGRVELKAMMPGRVVNVLVKAGDEVAQQQGVVVVEAMKMENELKSPKGGKVVEVKVAPGQAVEKGEVLIVID